jgi:hypothetical protein
LDSEAFKEVQEYNPRLYNWRVWQIPAPKFRYGIPGMGYRPSDGTVGGCTIGRKILLDKQNVRRYLPLQNMRSLRNAAFAGRRTMLMEIQFRITEVSFPLDIMVRIDWEMQGQPSVSENEGKSVTDSETENTSGHAAEQGGIFEQLQGIWMKSPGFFVRNKQYLKKPRESFWLKRGFNTAYNVILSK